MGCGSCGPNKHQPESTRRFKPENTSGCGSGNDNKCDTPSSAIKNTPRGEWEEKYGKLITNVTKKLGPDGRFYLDIQRVPCGKPEKPTKQSCCSLKYRIVR